MNVNKNIREKILNQPSYWVEGINGYLYEAILTYMEENNMKRKDLAKHLDISPGRVSQILNDGEINFSIDKIIQIALKIGKFPDFKLQDKETYLERANKVSEIKTLFIHYRTNQLSNIIEDNKMGKIIPINSRRENSLQLAL